MLLQSDVAEVPAAEHAAGEQFPWQLKCCSSNGETKLYQLPKKADDLFFAGTHPYCAGVPLQCAPVSSYTGPVIQHTMATSPEERPQIDSFCVTVPCAENRNTVGTSFWHSLSVDTGSRVVSMYLFC